MVAHPTSLKCIHLLLIHKTVSSIVPPLDASFRRRGLRETMTGCYMTANPGEQEERLEG